MRLAALSVWMLSSLVAAGLGAVSGQGLAGLQANWKDLETWSRLVDSSTANELGLGLQPTGGSVVAFLGRLSIRNPRTPPTEVRLHVAPAYMANPNVIRRRSLTFLADAGTDQRAIFDLSPQLVTDDPSPGGIITNAIGTMRAADFVRLTQAKTISANILGFDVIFRPDQIRAMQALAERLHLTGR